MFKLSHNLHPGDVVKVRLRKQFDNMTCKVLRSRNIQVRPLSISTFIRHPFRNRTDLLLVLQDKKTGRIFGHYAGREYSGRRLTWLDSVIEKIIRLTKEKFGV